MLVINLMTKAIRDTLRSRRWAQANPEKVRAKERIRRALKVGAGGVFTLEQFKELGDCCL